MCADLAQTMARQVAERVQGIGADEPRQQVGDVVDQRRIGDPQPRLERVFGHASEEIPQRKFGTISSH